MIPPSGTRFRSTDESMELSWVNACLEGIEFDCWLDCRLDGCRDRSPETAMVGFPLETSTGMGPNIDTAANCRGLEAMELAGDWGTECSTFDGDGPDGDVFDGDGRDAKRGEGNGLLHGDAGPAPRSRSDWPSDTSAVEPTNDATNTARIAIFLGRISLVVLEHALRCNRIDNSENGDAGWRNSTPESAPVQMEQSELPSHAIQSSCPLLNGEPSMRSHNANLEKSQRSLTSAPRDPKTRNPTTSLAC